MTYAVLMHPETQYADKLCINDRVLFQQVREVDTVYMEFVPADDNIETATSEGIYDEIDEFKVLPSDPPAGDIGVRSDRGMFRINSKTL